MFLIKKKIYLYLYIFFLLVVFIFNGFSTSKTFGKNFNISQVEIEENYNIDFDKSKVIDNGFKKAFKILIYKIVEKKDRSKFENVPLNEIKRLIESFSILDEKFINKKYKSQFEVQFNKKKILNYVEKKNAIPSIPEEIESFILPVLIDVKNNDLYYLNQNIFFNNWNLNSEKHFLINYVLPSEDIEDYLTIKKNIYNIEDYNFDEIINKYNLENHIILIILKLDKQLRVFSKIKFDKKKILVNKIYNNSNINDKETVNELIMNLKEDYEDKWKSINKINTSISLPIKISLNSKNIELSEKLEKVISEFDLVSNFKIENFNNREIIYTIVFNGTPDKFLESMLLLNFKIDISSKVWKLR